MAGSTRSPSCCFSFCLLFLVVPSFIAGDTTVPAPIVVSPSQYWEGNDGPWSSFTVQLGTPAQDVRVLISTAGTSTWVVLPEGCTSNDLSNCAGLRGQEFKINASSTWVANNFYGLELESNLGYSGNGEFGFDKVGLGWQGSNGPVLDHQVVAGIATTDFWLGTFGLTPRPTNFSDFNNPIPSFMETLKNKSLIPSLSWSYTAGAAYRLDKVLGSLVLGGYDLSKAGSTNMSFSFASDISQDLTVGLQAISASFLGKDINLLPDGIFTFIDSTVPHIWLPLEACQLFEKAFGLTWDQKTGLYLVNDTLHTTLTNSNISFTFKIGNTTAGGSTIDITLPYASFDLKVDYPIVANSTRYFPIMIAANNTQYTLGRTFLQETYLTADYERSEFSLSQCAFQQGASQHIIAIPSLNSISTNPPSSTSLSTGTIVGIVIGSVLVVTGLILCILYYLKRPPFSKNKSSQESGFPPDKKDETGEYGGKAELDTGTSPAAEVAGTAIEYFTPDKQASHELTDTSLLMTSPPPPPIISIHEMAGDFPAVQELAGGAVLSTAPSPEPVSALTHE